MRLPIISASGITASRVLILLTLPSLRVLSWTRSDCLATRRQQRIGRGKVPASFCASRTDPTSGGERLLTPIPHRTTVDLGLHFLGVALKLQRSRIAIEVNR